MKTDGRKWLIRLLTGIFVILLFPAGTGGMQETGEGSSGEKLLKPVMRIRVATTTSLYDTGLWGYLEPMFEENYGVELDVLYAGTGIALEYGRRGDVDVITVHSKSRELEFVERGYGVERVPFAYNYFVIAGPGDDPAGIKGKTAEEAFRALATGGNGLFVSRGDDSGTHGKEKAIWKSAGLPEIANSKKNSDTAGWLVEAGRGMGPTLLMADEKKAYTLCDIGTFLSYKGKISLVPLVQKGEILLNVYSAIAVSPEKYPRVKHDMARNLIEFLTSPRIQELIGNYGTGQYGEPLFTPCAGTEHVDQRQPRVKTP